MIKYCAKIQWLNDIICQEVEEHIKQGWSDLAFNRLRKFFRGECIRNKGTNYMISNDSYTTEI